MEPLRRLIRAIVRESAGMADHWAMGLPGNGSAARHLTLYITDGRRRRALERALASAGIEDVVYTSREEYLVGETDPHYRRHAKATLDFEATAEQEDAVEAALDALGGWSWSF